MAASELSNVLEPSELTQIPVDLQNKINVLLSSRADEVTNLKSKYEKLRVNSEQQYFDIEKQLITSNGKLETEVTQKNSLQERFQDLETKFAEATRNLQELQEKRDTFQTSEHEYKSTIRLLETEKRDLNIISSKREKEIERLTVEIDELSKKIIAANNEKCEAQVKLGELQSSEVSREYKEKRLEAEKSELEKQIEWFKDQLTEKTNQLSSVRKEKTNTMLELQLALDEKTQELTHQQSIVNSLKESLEKQGERLESTSLKLKEERESQVQIEEQFRQELGVQKRLVTLYKAAADENDEQVTGLNGAVEELKKLLKDSSEAYAQLESTKLEEIQGLELSGKEKEEVISKLQTELKNANDLMAAMKKGSIPLSEGAIESLSPSAAAVSKLLKSGMSLTQIYSEYVQVTDTLSEVKDENKRLNSYMEQIFQEIEEKAPLLKKQREDYETALQNLEQMTSQLDTVMLECEKLRADNDDVKRRHDHIQRECNRYQQTCQDLSKQVQRLLREQEELRGGRVVTDEVANVSSSEVSSSSIITEKLVTFRNIEELQKQNEKLIEVCRDLSEKKERQENDATSEKMKEMKEQLEFAMSELDHLKDARSRQAEMLESIVRQRDMYRVLVQQGGSLSDVPATPQVTSTPRQQQHVKEAVTTFPSSSRGVDGNVGAKELDAAREALKELKAEFDAYKKDRSENDKLLNESTEKAKQSLADMRVSNAKLTTQLNFATERYKIVQDNVAGYKKEINLLQERSHLQASTIHKHESAVAHLKEELMSAKENVARWQVQLENVKKEKELIKNSEKRLTMELESIRREHSAQAMLTASLQAIQNNLERSEFEMKTRHTNKVEGLERELANLRRKLETILEEKTQQSTVWEDIVKNVHMEIKHEKEKGAALQTKADNAKLELETVKQELSVCEAKLAAAETKLENLVTQANREETPAAVEERVETEAVKDLKNSIAEQQLLIKSLRQQLEAAKKHANQFKTIADDVEQKMKEQTEATKEVEKGWEKKVIEAQAQRNSLEGRVELLEQDLEAANRENARLTAESSSLHGDLRKQVTSLQHELEEAVGQKQTAIDNCEAALQDSKNQAEIASQAQDKYQRELMLHAADVEALAAVKKQLEDIQEHLQQTQEETATYEKQLDDAKTSWAEQEKVYKEEIKSIEGRCEELTRQNAVLHEQMSKLSSQVVSIQQRARRDSTGSNTSFSDEQGKSSEQLLEVVKFLRREKEIAETKLQVVETECARVKQRCLQVEKQAEEATKSLAEERQKAQVSAETTANQLELMRKVSNYNVLTDSNKLLRDERDQLLNTKQELEAKIRQLETDIEPFQAKIRELESQRDAVTVERDALKDEANRWKSRTSSLIEQSNRTDPEENKRLLAEKENLRKQLAHARDESIKHKTELTRVAAQNTSLQAELNNLKQEASKINQELSSMKSVVEEKNKENDNKANTINRLKQIGRKYKEQADKYKEQVDKTNKELEDVKVKAAGQETDKVNVASLEQEIAGLRRTVTENSTKISTLEAQLTEAQNEAQAATKRAEQTVAENTQLRETQNRKEEELKQSRETSSKLQGEVEELKRNQSDFDKKTAEFERKTAQSRQVMQSARSKILDQQGRMKQLESEIAELKTKAGGDDEITALKAQVSQLQADLSESRRNLSPDVQALQTQLDRLKTENAELLAKVHQLPRPVSQQGVPTRPAGSVAPTTSTSDAPKTANIKPMAPASSSSRQATQSITSHPSHSPAAVKATASIRPMAISPTTSTLPVSGTPTATVMPTTVSQTEVDTLPGPSGLQQASIPGVPVSGRVQIVEPQVMERNQQDTGDQTEDTGLATNQAVVTPSVQQEVPAAAAIPITQVVNPVAPTTASLPSTSGASGSTPVAAVAAEILPSQQQQQQQQQQHTTGVVLGKRTREEDSFTTEETDSKRSRVNTQDQTIPTITVIDENQQLVTQIQPSTTTAVQQGGVQTSKPTAAAVPAVAASVAVVPAETPSSTSWQAEQDNSGDEDVIMVLSDEDEPQEDDEDDQAEEEEADDDYEEDDDDDDDEDDEEDDIGQSLDQDVVEIIETEDADQGEAQIETVVPAPQTPPLVARPSATLQPLSAASGEGISQDAGSGGGGASRTQQIAPFMIGNQGLLEDDDCRVPSTPTLSQPRRGDGFAEALNSPAVNQRFSFGVDSSGNSDLAQLESQRALGMDDTRMDLSQLGETGHSFPTTTSSDLRPERNEAEGFSVGASEGEEISQVRETSAAFGSSGGQQEQGEEEDDNLLDIGEAMGDDEEIVAEEEASDPQASGEGPSRSSVVREESDSASQDKPEASAKPQIKKIVWDATPDSTSSSGSSSGGAVAAGNVMPSLLGGPPSQPRISQGRGQTARRGQPRGRGSVSQYFSGQAGQSRGGNFSYRGNRGGRGGPRY